MFQIFLLPQTGPQNQILTFLTLKIFGKIKKNYIKLPPFGLQNISKKSRFKNVCNLAACSRRLW